MGHADHIIDLNVAAGADAKRAIDTGIEVYSHRGVRNVGPWCQAGGETTVFNTQPVSPLPEF